MTLTHATQCVRDQLAQALLQGLCIQNPTDEQRQAAESFVTWVILPSHENGPYQPLSPKEWICLHLAANGFSIQETAELLASTEGVIKNYREHIMDKLRCKNITHAVYQAFLYTPEGKVLTDQSLEEG